VRFLRSAAKHIVPSRPEFERASQVRLASRGVPDEVGRCPYAIEATRLR